NSATAVSRGERRGKRPARRPGPPFNSATAVSRGERPSSAAGRPASFWSFNSATAVSRGERGRTVKEALAASRLQFGHGSEPWGTHLLNQAVDPGRAPSIRPRQ